MSEALFWKPGEERPAKKADTRKQQSNGNGRNKSPSRSGTRPTSQSALPDAKPNSAASTPARKTKLSGTTMNMRFMMRKQIRGDSNEVETAQSSPMEVDTNDKGTRAQPQHRVMQNGPATGQESVFLNVLGRRSFGGFNRHAENAWQEHATFYGTTSSRKRNDKADPTSDSKSKRKRKSR